MKTEIKRRVTLAYNGLGLGAVVCVLMSFSSTASAADEQELIKRGEARYNKLCALCHEVGTGTYIKGRQLHPDFIAAIVRNGLLAMPAFPHTHLSDEDLLAVGKYIQQSSAPEEK